MTVDELFSLGLRLNSNIRCIEIQQAIADLQGETS